MSNRPKCFFNFAFSTNDGTNWFQGQEPPGVTGGGTAAEAADASATVWSTGGAGVFYSTSYGGSWTTSTGLPSRSVR